MNSFAEVLDEAKDLKQHGVKGQKWGVRRDKSARASKPEVSEDAAKAAVYKKQARKAGVSTLSNDQLKELTKRLELETKYQSWAAKNPTLKKQAVDFIAKELAKEGMSRAGVGQGSQVASAIRQAMATQKANKRKNPPNAGQKPGAGFKPRPKPSPGSPAKPRPVYKITSLN